MTEENQEVVAEFFVERMDYGLEFDEYSYLYFGCHINGKRILFPITVSNSADGIYVEDVAVSAAIFNCDQAEQNAVREVYDRFRRAITVYYEVAVYGHQGYPFPKRVIEALLQMELTPIERQKVLDVLNELTYIYLIKDFDTGLIKIGRSNDPQSRLEKLRKQDTLMPKANNFVLLGYWTGYPFQEGILHKKFADKRVRGEWFKLTDEEVNSILEYNAE